MILENIKNLCKTRGITVAEVERSTGIANGAIGKWGTKIPRVDNLKSVADFFGVTVDELLRGKEDMQ